MATETNLPGSVNAHKQVNIHDDAFLEQIEMQLSSDEITTTKPKKKTNGDNDENKGDEIDSEEEIITQHTLSILDEMKQNDENNKQQNGAISGIDENQTQNANTNNTNDAYFNKPRKHTVESTNLDAISSITMVNNIKNRTDATTTNENEEEIVTNNRNEIKMDVDEKKDTSDENIYANNSDNESGRLILPTNPNPKPKNFYESKDDIMYDEMKTEHNVFTMSNESKETKIFVNMLEEKRKAEWDEYVKHNIATGKRPTCMELWCTCL